MFNKALLMAYAKSVYDSRNTLSFVASKDGSAINFFADVDPTIHSSEFYTVFVNGEETEQVFTSLTFAMGDEVKITCSGKNGFPRLYCHSKDYVKSVSVLPYMTYTSSSPIFKLDGAFYSCSSLTSIPEGLFDNNAEVKSFSITFSSCGVLTSIPEGLFDNNTKVTSFSSTFNACSALTSIPEGLFDNNAEVTEFNSAFQNCQGLTSVPDGLFDNNTLVKTFERTFLNCKSLTSIPIGLFNNNTRVTSFKEALYGCASLSGRVKIGSPAVTNASGFCTKAGAMTVIVPAGSTTEATFRAYADTVTNLTVETF